MFSNKQMQYFEKAANVAATSEFFKHHLGCIAVLKNKIIAASANKLKTHPIQAVYDQYRFKCESDLQNMHSLHAEIACLNMIKQDIDFRDLELYIVRLRKNGEYGLARPCPSCFQYIIEKGIWRINYSTNYGFAQEVLCK
jgi:deoxycytidylate deaminase